MTFPCLSAEEEIEHDQHDAGHAQNPRKKVFAHGESPFG
jgi:hypothetical protein